MGNNFFLVVFGISHASPKKDEGEISTCLRLGNYSVYGGITFSFISMSTMSRERLIIAIAFL